MSQIKRKIIDMSTPAIHNRRNIHRIGKVIKTTKNSNICIVEFKDKDGYVVTREAVINVYNTNFIWLPKDNDFVNMTIDHNGSITIDSLFVGNYSANAKKNTKLKQDIYTNTFADETLGFIF